MAKNAKLNKLLAKFGLPEPSYSKNHRLIELRIEQESDDQDDESIETMVDRPEQAFECKRVRLKFAENRIKLILTVICFA